MKNLDENQIDILLYYMVPTATWLCAVAAGTWWIDNDIWRGTIFLAGLYIYSIMQYVRIVDQRFKKKLYTYVAYIAPCAVGTGSFILGLVVKY